MHLNGVEPVYFFFLFSSLFLLFAPAFFPYTQFSVKCVLHTIVICMKSNSLFCVISSFFLSFLLLRCKAVTNLVVVAISNAIGECVCEKLWIDRARAEHTKLWIFMMIWGAGEYIVNAARHCVCVGRLGTDESAERVYLVNDDTSLFDVLHAFAFQINRAIIIESCDCRTSSITILGVRRFRANFVRVSKIDFDEHDAKQSTPAKICARPRK